MRHDRHLLTHLQRAEDLVQNARHSWDATDISRCAECLEHLRQAAAEIQAAQQLTSEAALQAPEPAAKRSGAAPCAAQSAEPAAQAKHRLEQLHGSVNRLGRLVDAAIAFHRGLALHTGMDEAVSSKGNG
jgi:hypothetical protein